MNVSDHLCAVWMGQPVVSTSPPRAEPLKW